MTISNHPVDQEELMAYLDGELQPHRAADTATHLEQCAHCQRLDAELQDVSEMLRSWEVEESELELTQEAVEAMEKRPAGGTGKVGLGAWLSFLNPRGWPRQAWGLVAAGVIVAAFMTLKGPFSSRRQSVMEGFISPGVPQQSTRVPKSPVRANRPARKTPTASKADSVASDTNGALTNYSDGSLSSAPLVAPTPLPNDMDSSQDEEDGQGEPDNTAGNGSIVNGPMIIRTAELEVTAKEFDKARSSVDEILKRRHGYVGELNVNTPTGAARSLTGTLRVPANQLDATLGDIKALGRTEKEVQGGEEVTQQYVDLQARLANAQHTEQRLTDILRERTGKLSDVLAVEMQISRVRGEIEQMEAQRKTMKNQVDFATLTITLNEEYKEQLKAVPASTSTQFRNAAVEGYRSLVDGIISVLLWLLAVGPTLLVWAAILFFPARMVWRKLRPRFAKELL